MSDTPGTDAHGSSPVTPWRYQPNARLTAALRRWLRPAFCLLVLGCLVCPASPVRAQDLSGYTIDNYMEWLQKYADAKPDFKPGDVLTVKDLERMRPFVPPGYFEQLNFPELHMEIAPPSPHPMARVYQDCTEKYGSQVRLAPDGALVNYLCGQPFLNGDLNTNDATSGMKAAWNFDYHWDYYGLNGMLIWVWDRMGGSHQAMAPSAVEAPPPSFIEGINYVSQWPTNIASDFGGGGTFQRILQSYYQRAKFSHLAQLADQGGLVPLKGAKDFEWKEFNYFVEPFDIRGTAFIIFRYEDPHRADDAWAYVPTLRRVRRISAEVKSDSLLGTDFCLDDFYGFNGRPLEWNWKFLGWKQVLAVTDPKWDFPHFYGPNGTIPDDRWTLRQMAVIQRIPKDPRYPYKSALMFVVGENWFSTYHFAFDRGGKLWKVVDWRWKYTEEYQTFAEINHGVHSMVFQNATNVDIQNKRGTMVPGPGFGYPDLNARQVERVFDINRLEEIHR